MRINIPDEAGHIIGTLEENGYEAYAVGGCVRDSILGLDPKDWDICTSATPQQAKEVFSGRHIIETGLKHGTITLILDHKPFEITTFRVDGIYSDNRRPDTVEFVGSLKADLARRDFTINAMAYSPKTGVVDFFGGMDDIRGIIKCVGEAGDRFREDALRIMRALRFASQLGFSIEEGTAKAVVENRGLLKNISAERVAAELNKFIVGDSAAQLMQEYAPVFAEIIPELAPMFGFEQNHRFHCYDVWTHTLKSVENAPKDQTLRLTMLLHDIAKPQCYLEEEDRGRFPGHQQPGSEMAGRILRRLRYDNETVDTVKQLILHHDAKIQPERKTVKRWLNRIGEHRLRQLIEVKKADIAAQDEKYLQERLDIITGVQSLADEIIEQQLCFSLKDLAVNGSDIIALGVREGAEIGTILNQLVDIVINEEADNDKAQLLEIAGKLKANSI